MGGACSAYGVKESHIQVLVGKLEGKRPRRKWENNIKMDLQEVGCGGLDWIDRDRCLALVIAVLNFWVL
jgi:hypothetical protein